MPDPNADLRTGRLGLRSFARDLERLQFLGTPRDEGQVHGAAAPGPDGPSVPNWVVPAVGGGPQGQRIAEVSQFLAHTKSSSLNYWSDPNVACASFVSTVLIQAGLFPRKTPGVPELAVVLPQTGAIQVYPRGTLITDEALDRLLPGDIILLHHATSRYKHTGVYLGNHLMNDNSSGKEHIVTRHPSIPGYRFMAVWRYPH